MTAWHETQANLTALYAWLQDNGWFAATRSTTNFWSEPWHWEREWELYQEWLVADSDVVREALEDALVEDRTAGDVLAEIEEQQQGTE